MRSVARGGASLQRSWQEEPIGRIDFRGQAVRIVHAMGDGRKYRLLGAVLAGGHSRRFGSDKALALLNGKPLLEHAAEAIGGYADSVVLCGRHYPDFLSLPDRPEPDMGPLGGLNAALHRAQAEGYDAVLSVACDMPILPDSVARQLIGEGAAVAKGQHLLGYWPTSLADLLDRHLAESDDRSVRGWLMRIQPRLVQTPELPNINRPEDLRRLEEG